jgi:hypothetical protein
VWQKTGLLRADKSLGTCELKLLDIETKSTIHQSMDLMQGRKAVGGKREVKVRIRKPIVQTQATSVRSILITIYRNIGDPQMACIGRACCLDHCVTNYKTTTKTIARRTTDTTNSLTCETNRCVKLLKHVLFLF